MSKQLRIWLFALLGTLLASNFLLAEGVITMTTDRAIGKTIKLKIEANGDVSITGVRESARTDGYSKDYTLTNQTVIIRGDVAGFGCQNNQLTSLDVSKNTALRWLNCSYNPLTSLDVSDRTALQQFWCMGSALTSLNLSGCTALTELNCSWGQLTSLDVSACPKLNYLDCSVNEIKKEAMTQLVASLPTCTSGYHNRRYGYNYPGGYFIVASNFAQEGNFCLKECVDLARKKGWTSLMWRSKSHEGGVVELEPYGGEDLSLNVGQGVITMTTTKAVGETITLVIKADGGVTIEGVKSFLQPDGRTAYYALTSQTIVIRGDVTKLDCRGNQLTSLDVSGCTSLTTLDCSYSQLTSLKVSGSTALTELYCRSNQLTSLDVSKNKALTELRCYDNKLISLDVSSCTALTTLGCSENRLTSLDVSSCTALTELYCSNNQLTSLDVSGCTALTTLGCSENRLTSLYVSGCTALRWLNSERNQLTSLDVSGCSALTTLDCNNNQLTSLDLSACPQLYRLDCSANEIKEEAMTQLVASLPTYSSEYSGDFGNFIAVSNSAQEGNFCSKANVASARAKNWNSKKRIDGDQVPYEGEDDNLQVGNGVITMTTTKAVGETIALAIKANGGIAIEGAKTPLQPDGQVAYYTLTSQTITIRGDVTELSCPNNQLTSLNVSGGSALTSLNCRDNQLTSLNVSGCTSLTELRCYDNQLTSLDVSGCTALTELYCRSNQLTSLDVSKNTALTELNCSDNQLTSLDVSGGSALTTLSCEGNQLTRLDVSNCTSLTRLVCGDGDFFAERGVLKSLNASGCTALKELQCHNNQLTSLDVSGCTSLTKLNCSNNLSLTSLDVSDCTSLTELNCMWNNLTSLDVSKNTALTTLDCYNSNLTSLDVSKNTALTELDCGYNRLTSLDLLKNSSLIELNCYGNALTSLDLSKCLNLRYIDCSNNRIKGEAMSRLVASLPTCSGDYHGQYSEHSSYSGGYFVAVSSSDNEWNNCSKENIATARAKNWTPLNKTRGFKYYILELVSYEGVDLNQPVGHGVITMTTGRAVGEPITLLFRANGPVTLKGVKETLQSDGSTTYQILPGQKITFRGDVTALSCGKSELTSLDVSGCTSLTKLYCSSNQLTRLDVSQNIALTSLNCGGNQLTSLNVSQNRALQRLVCYENQLTSLNVSQNTSLRQLNCYDNQLTSLDVSQNATLGELYCGNNQLISLNVSQNLSLYTLYCQSNQLTSLDLSHNSKLMELGCSNNQIKGAEMTKLVNSLPKKDGRQSSEFYVVVKDSIEGNVCLKSDVAIVANKGWTPLGYNRSTEVWEYYGGRETDSFGVSLTHEGEGLLDAAGADDLKAVPYGTKLTITATPAEGYELAALTANGLDILERKSYEVTGYTEIKAIFRKKTFAISLAESAHGEIAIAESVDLKAVPYGTTLTITATPETGYELTALTANEEDILIAKSLVVKSDTEVKATFNIKHFAVTLTQEGEGKVNATGADNLKAVPYGTELIIEATPAEGCELTALTANGHDILATRKVVVTEATEIKATFVKKTFVVTLPQEGEGTITARGAEDLNAVPYGTELVIEATPDEGYELTALAANGQDILATRKVVVKEATEIKATFVKKTFVVTLEKAGEGDLSTTGADNLKKVPYGTELTIIATPAPGYELASIVADGVNVTATKKFVIKDNVTVKATFTKKTFKVTLTKEGEGTITATGASNLNAVAYGTELTIVATPAEGYELQSLVVDGVVNITATKKVVVTDNVTIKATFVDHTGVATTITQQTQLYPNPATDYVIVEGVAPASEVTLHSMTGERLYAGRADSRGVLQIDLTPYADGVYLVCVAGETYRVVVRR